MRRATGQVIEPSGKRKAYALRFRAYGQRRYVRLGRPDEGWTLAKAEKELRHLLADVERGQWEPEEVVKAPASTSVPTFRVFASEWLARKRKEGLAENTMLDYEWAIVNHLLPYFNERPVNTLTVADVDGYKLAKAEEGRLNNNSVNQTITRLSQILQDAVEHGHLVTNPAAGRRRRLKPSKPQRRWVHPDQLMALLEAAGEQEGGYSKVARPLLATLAGAGLRISEALALTWGDVSMASRSIRVREAKTDAGVREVHLSPSLVEELSELKASMEDPKPEEPVFCSTHHEGRDGVGAKPLDRHRARERILKPAVKLADEKLAKRGIDPIGHVTPHGLRHTYASIQLTLTADLPWVIDQLGHGGREIVLSVYTHPLKRRSRLSPEALKAHDQALQWAHLGTNEAEPMGDELAALVAEAAQPRTGRAT